MISLTRSPHVFTTWETAWIFSRARVYIAKVQKCTVTSRKDRGHTRRTMEEKGKMSSSTTIHSGLVLFFVFPLAISLLSFFFLYPSCLQAETVHTADLTSLCLAIVSVSLWHTAHCFPSLQHRVKYPSSIHSNHMARSH